MKLQLAISVLALGALWGTVARARVVQLDAKPRVLVLDPAQHKVPTALVGVRVQNPGRARVELVALKTNVGTLGKPSRKGAATWVATYTPPDLHFPTVALMRADLRIDGKLVRRWRALPVALRLALPVATKGAVDVSVSVGSREFGPVTPKKRQLQVAIPVIIPPGAQNYTISRVTEQGVTSAETKRFRLPPFPRLVVVGPKTPAAGSTIRVDVFHVGAKGERYSYNVPLLVDCPAGTIVKLKGQRSVQSIWIKLSGTTGPARIRVAVKQESGIAAVHAFRVELAKTLRLAVSATPRRLGMTTSKSVQVLVRVTDLFGNAAATPSLRVTANGRPLSMARIRPGLWRGWLYAPTERQPGDRLVLRATAPRAREGTAVVRLLGGVAERLSIRVAPRAIMADGKRGVKVEIRAVDRLGMAPQDRTIKVESDHGRLDYLHHVKPGLFRGWFVPNRNNKGGVAVITASTRRAQEVQARLRLLPIPQRMLLSPVLGAFSDTGRALGIQAGLRYEYAVYHGPPAVHLGFQVLAAPHVGVGNRTAADAFAGFSAGVAALVRLRLVSHRRFGLDVAMDLGVLGIYASYKRFNPPAVDRHQRGRAAFTTSAALEAGLRTVGQNEVFLQLRLRYLTVGFADASSDNHVTLFAGLGYRFEL